MHQPKNILSVVVPIYNEGNHLEQFHSSIIPFLETAVGASFEIIYCDDGSKDNSASVVRKLRDKDNRVKLLKLTRNFGKEYALTAGIRSANGQAVLTLDGDGQHPVERIPDFVKAWRQGTRVVVGVRTNNVSKSFLKNIGSTVFYHVFNKLSQQKILPGSTDFRLIDRSVQQEFLQLGESDRITRGLIDWLGFEYVEIPITALARKDGRPSYSRKKLLELAANSLISFSSLPLYLFGYLGIIITLLSFILGTSVFVEQLLLHDPLHWKFTGTAMLGILLLFMVGVVLLSQGLLSLYISAIHSNSKQRPLFVIDYEKSAGVIQPHD